MDSVPLDPYAVYRMDNVEVPRLVTQTTNNGEVTRCYLSDFDALIEILHLFEEPQKRILLDG